MTTIAHGRHEMADGRSERPWLERGIVTLTLVWAALGPIAFVAYGDHISTHTWYRALTLNGSQLADLQASYFSGAILNCAIGFTAWVFGLAVLGVLSWRYRPRDDIA